MVYRGTDDLRFNSHESDYFSLAREVGLKGRVP